MTLRKYLQERISEQMRASIWCRAVDLGLRPKGHKELIEWIEGFLVASPHERIDYVENARVPIYAVVYAGGLRQAVHLVWRKDWGRYLGSFSDDLYVPTINTAVNNLFVIGQLTSALPQELANHDTDTWCGMGSIDSVEAVAVKSGIDYNQAWIDREGKTIPERGPLTTEQVVALFRSQGRGPKGETLNMYGEPIHHDENGRPFVVGPRVPGQGVDRPLERVEAVRGDHRMDPVPTSLAGMPEIPGVVFHPQERLKSV